MAGLRKPNLCPECNSIELHREYSPEKWVCINKHIVISRQSKPRTGVCRECGISKDNIEFHNRRNICKPCAFKKHKEWTNNNVDKLRQYRNNYWAEKGGNTEKWKYVRNIIQSNIDSFLKQLASRCRRQSNVKSVVEFGGTHTNSPIHICDIDYTYLKEIWDKQKGLCNLTGLVMVHEYGKLNTVSVDRIDSSKGYLKGNIQLICAAINKLKCDHDNDEVVQFINNIRKIVRWN